MIQDLQIDFIPRKSPWRWLAYLCCAVGLLLAAQQIRAYWRLSKQLGTAEEPWHRLQLPAAVPGRSLLAAHDVRQQEQLRNEQKAARRTIGQLLLPWDGLFRDIESAMSAQVSLLGIEPDPERKEIHITAEAKDMDAMLMYVRQMMNVSSLRNVYLLSHQMQLQDPQKPVRFVIAARWSMSGVSQSPGGEQR